MFSSSYKSRREKSFSLTSQKVYGAFQIIIGLLTFSLAITQIVLNLELNRIITVFECVGGVYFILAGCFGCHSANTRSLCHLITCLVLTAFGIVCASVLVALYPFSLLLKPEQIDNKPEWFIRTILLVLCFLFAIIEWCLALCQIMVSYAAIRFLVSRGYDGFSDPREFNAKMFEASFEPSEETLLLHGRYYETRDAHSMDACEQMPGTSGANLITTTALITPSAPIQGWDNATTSQYKQYRR